MRAHSFTVPIGEMPILLVIKKYGSILDNLLGWVTKLHGVPVSQNSEERRVPGIPLLVIDDEADNASINTKNADETPTAINKKIRRFLKAFDKSAYVGYTATPFANIYSSKSEDREFGLDLFPRHFIENLKAPSNYFGPTRVFGLDAADDDEAKPPLPIFRDVPDYSPWVPDSHKAGWRPNPAHFPQSLKEAVFAFFLVCAARRARGQETKHNSMLIHTTRYQLVQAEVAEQVEDFMRTSGYRLRYGDGNADSIWEELKKLWENDFQQTSTRWDCEVEPLGWDVVRPHVTPAVDKIQMRTINGASQDALEYYDNRKTGLSVIGIGGDKLSRGLTLEGLSVSYYLRATKMYDTLMQMGRWFGYRPGYEDLCRLYTTTTLRDWYREITAASEELRADFDDMAEKKGTPEDYGLRVRQSAAGLSVTAPSKMRSAKTITMTFSGDVSESVTFQVEDDVVARNRANLEHFIERLQTDSDLEYSPAAKDNGMGGNYVWSGVPGAAVAEFFDGYQGDPMALRAKPQLLSGYIREGVERGELVNWTVVLVTSSTPRNRKQIAGLGVGLTIRTPLNGIDEVRTSKRYTIRRVLSPSDESLDLSKEQRAAAMAALRDELRKKESKQGKEFKDPEYPRGATLRAQRTADRGLLLLYPLDDVDEAGHRIASDLLVGFAASFPFSATKLTAKYRVNETWFKQMLSEMPDDDGDDENDD